MILVINANPALDRVAVVRFRHRATLRPLRFLTWPGGSGVHAGHVAHMLGADVSVHAFAAGHTGALFREALLAHHLQPELLEVPGETRQTFSLLDVDEGNICDVVEQGPSVTVEAAQQLEALARRRIPDATVVIISGSLPRGCPTDLPAHLVAAAREVGVPCIADLAGPLLLETLPARPWLIKPSRAELAELSGAEVPTTASAVPLARHLLEAGAENVCISLDAAGLLWVSAVGAVQFVPPHVAAYNSIGCGDTLVGALAAAYAETHDLEHALRVGVAAAAANLRYDAPGHCTPDDVTALIGGIGCQVLAS